MRFSAFLALLTISAVPAVAKECRMPDVPPDVHVQLPPECQDRTRKREAEPANQGYLRAEQGFMALGNRTSVRIGGRARAEMGVRP